MKSSVHNAKKPTPTSKIKRMRLIPAKDKIATKVPPHILPVSKIAGSRRGEIK